MRIHHLRRKLIIELSDSQTTYEYFAIFENKNDISTINPDQFFQNLYSLRKEQYMYKEKTNLFLFKETFDPKQLGCFLLACLP